MISSTSNARVRLLRGLTDRRTRLHEGLFLVEGVRLAEEVVDAGVRPALVLFDEALRQTERGRTLLADLEPLSDWAGSGLPGGAGLGERRAARPGCGAGGAAGLADAAVTPPANRRLARCWPDIG